VLTIVVLNKTSAAITDSIGLANFTPAGAAQVWQYSSANLGAIVRQSDISLNGSGLSTTFPAQSITLLVIPQSQSVMAVPQPVVNAVTNGASYGTGAISPGELVAIWGTGLGASAGAGLTLDSTGLVQTSLGGTRVFINGNPAPLIYAGPGQVNAAVPYEVAFSSTANVVVVYQGNPSAFPTVLGQAARALARVLREHLGKGLTHVFPCGRDALAHLTAVQVLAPMPGHYLARRQQCGPRVDRPVFSEVDEVHRLNGL
jgi:hypothetical protein